METEELFSLNNTALFFIPSNFKVDFDLEEDAFIPNYTQRYKLMF